MDPELDADTLLMGHVDKLIEALDVYPEDYRYEGEEYEGEDDMMSLLSHMLSTPSLYMTEDDEQFMSSSQDEEEEEEEEEEVVVVEEEEESSETESSDSDKIRARILLDGPSNDLEHSVILLRRKVASIEAKNEHLFRVIDYLTKDMEIILKLEEMKPFPWRSEKVNLRRLFYKLQSRLLALEAQMMADEASESRSSSDSDLSVLTERQRSRSKTLTILDELFKVRATNPRLQSAFGFSTNGEVLQILQNDLQRMQRDMSTWQTVDEHMLDGVEHLHGRAPKDAFLTCVQQVRLMRLAVDIMTGGQFERGADITFLNPNRMRDLESRLDEVGGRLASLEALMQTMADYDRRIRHIMHKFAPYIRSIIYDVPLPGETEQKDIGLDLLHTRIEVIQTAVHNIAAISEQLLKSQAERDNRLVNIREEIERLRYVKVDKEDVVDILTEKADPADSDTRVDSQEFVHVLKNVALFNNTCTIDLADRELLWRKVMSDLREDGNRKANLADLRLAKRRIVGDVGFLVTILREVRERITRRLEVSKQLEDTVCASCGEKIELDSKDVGKLVDTSWVRAARTRVRGRKHSLPHPARTPAPAQGPRCTLSGKRISKRFCGSSHTITTPQQRVFREKHHGYGPCIQALCPVHNNLSPVATHVQPAAPAGTPACVAPVAPAGTPASVARVASTAPAAPVTPAAPAAPAAAPAAVAPDAPVVPAAPIAPVA